MLASSVGAAPATVSTSAPSPARSLRFAVRSQEPQLSMADGGPTLSVEGRLRDLAGKLLFGQGYAVWARATDSEEPYCYPDCPHGVDRIELTVDGVVREFTSQRECRGPGCALDLNYSLSPYQIPLTPGPHEVRVTATDFAGDASSLTWTVVVSLYADRTEDEILQDSLEFRQAFGLGTDAAYLDQIMHDPALEPNWEYYDVPLTSSELDLVDNLNEDTFDPWTGGATDGTAGSSSQAEEQAALPSDPIERYGQGTAVGVYAGSYIDAGRILVGFTRDAAVHVSRLRRLTEKPLASFKATYSLAHLRSVQERIDRDWDELRAIGVEVTRTGVDIPKNVVMVGVKSASAALIQVVQDRYGPAVRIVTSTGVELIRDRWEMHDPMIAGLRIDDESTDVECTSGFSFPITYQEGPLPVQRQATLTAAHCGPLGSTWSQGGETLGFMDRRHLVDEGSSDGALIELYDREARNYIYVNDFTRRVVTRAQNDDRVGQISCVTPASFRNGRNRCGRLILTNETVHVTFDGDPLTLRNMRIVRPYRSNIGKMCRPGASGAAVFRTARQHTTAKGILTAAIDDGAQCAYSHIRHVYRDLNLEFNE